ncbi:MAG: hypothetical protein GY936_01495 [Ignavibacteriae bacterium]|nr:hypothetical protein [Ignavibacteriota bacterium]
MKKKIMLLLMVVFLLQTCKNEVSQNSKVSGVDIQLSEKKCFVNNIHEKNDKIYATLNFIEYQKIMDLDSTITKNQVLELPNGFCYIDEKVILENFKFSKTPSIVMQTLSYNTEGNFNFNQSIGLNELLEYFKKPESERLKFSPFKIKLKGKEIVSLEEIYIP